MQLFNIKVFVYPERVEIKGTIPTQVLDKSTEEEPDTALIINSPLPLIREGGMFIRGACPSLTLLLSYRLMKGHLFLLVAKDLIVKPSPKSHLQFVIVPVELSVKWTTRGAGPSTESAVKSAVRVPLVLDGASTRVNPSKWSVLRSKNVQ